ncbi:cation:proton antiporter [Vineibacter terrae]|uniref:cation:proton antiporter n=1 Tax=Vineibacter terrae TaxID=2586908 RepID=UPI002E325E9C|nr:cation:proton antiporter [Vineibacter terrae]HEX2888028.1 cation:proton antiporter [Vineibacter terrae]
MDIIPATGLDLPPLTRFVVITFVLLFLPRVTERLRIPGVVAFIIAGVVVGPHGLGVMPRHAEAANFIAELGKLLLMFFVGLEIDLQQFKAARRRSLAFGLTTFALPMAAGMAVGFAFGYGAISAILIGSLMASHTLVAYPIIQKAGLVSRPSVTVTVGATILTDMLSLLVLAVCLTTHQTGFDIAALALQLGELAALIAIAVVGLGYAGKWLFDRFGNTENGAFTLMLLSVAAMSSIAELMKLEGILGAFLAGLAVNAVVRKSPAKEKLEFLGDAFFIPAFFLVTGFLIDLKLFAATILDNAPLVLAVVLGLLASKWLAAEIVGRRWGFSATDRGLMGSLTMPQVAATLAAALVGYQAVNAAGVRLIDERMLNTILVLVVVSSVLGPVLTERFVRTLPGKKDAPAGLPPQAVPVSADGTPA